MVSGLEIQEGSDFLSAAKKIMMLQRSRLASLGSTPGTDPRRAKGEAFSNSRGLDYEKRKGQENALSYAEATKSKPPKEGNDWMLVGKKRKKTMRRTNGQKALQERKRQEGKGKMTKRSSHARSRNSIKMSVRDGQSNGGIKKMEARVNFQEPGLEALSVSVSTLDILGDRCCTFR